MSSRWMNAATSVLEISLPLAVEKGRAEVSWGAGDAWAQTEMRGCRLVTLTGDATAACCCVELTHDERLEQGAAEKAIRVLALILGAGACTVLGRRRDIISSRTVQQLRYLAASLLY